MFLNDGDFLFCDAGRHNNDDKIKIHDALIWLLQDLSKYPRKYGSFTGLAPLLHLRHIEFCR